MDFEEMVFSYEELKRREEEHYYAINPKQVYAWHSALEYSERRAQDSLRVIFGKEVTNNFINQYNEKKRNLSKN